jgi:V8-like Glu-specific endopeptidase
MKVAVRVIGVLLAVVLIAAFVLEPASTPQAVAAQDFPKPVATTAEEEVVSSASVLTQGQSRSDWVWTPERIASAKPYPLQTREGSAETLAPQTGFAPSPGSPQLQTFPAGLPEGEVSYANDLSGLEAFALPGASAPTGYSYPAPFTRYVYYGRYIKEYPYKTIGKLFFVQYGTAYVCSASSIGNYAIWTAGHCVHYGDGSPNGWSYALMFAPGYDNGKFPGKRWFAEDWNLWSLNGWINSGNLAYDMGGAVLNTIGRKKISQKVGWLGFAYTPDTSPYYAQYHWFGIGYPQASPFDGQKQVVCASSYAYSDAAFSPMPVGVGCDQTGGTSGGPWILAFGSGYYVNGNMSYRYINPNHPLEMFSPYFGNGALNLFNALVTDVP